MRTYRCLGCALLSIAVVAGNLASAAEEKTSSIGSTLRIQSARITRSSADFNKRFPGRYYSYDGNAGVSLSLVLSVSEGIMLPISNDAITVETFVDDTYQSLQTAGVDASISGNRQGTVSEDGKSVLFTVATSRTPADDAGRIFVRGALNARVSRVGPVVATNQVSMNVGEEAVVGPFHTAIQAASQNATPGLNVSITITGDAARIQKIRVLDENLNSVSEGRLSSPEIMERPATASLNVRGSSKGVMILEITYLEKADRVQIPFEAQVDIGVAKAGPVEPGGATPPKRAGVQTWPPPRENAQNLPARRPAFNPDQGKEATNARPRLVDSAAVDIFSLSVGKSDPSELPSVVWKNPPSSAFHASGFTTARLMLSVPGVSILSIPPDGVSVTRFEDDKGTKLDSTLFRESSSSSYSAYPSARYSPDGQQMLLTLSLAGSPSPGATRCTLGGEIQAKVGRGESTNFTDKVDLRRGDSFTAGPFTGKVTTLRETPPFQPPFTGLNFELWLSISGPVNKLRSVEILDRDGKPFSTTPVAPADFASPQSGEVRCAFHLPNPIRGAVRFKFCYYVSDEIVRVPFELNTGIGL